uniref:Uncharacterized protein n=1 Tax=Opuntia streptacantha TaxID=393608 RepID=A0A7C8YLB3_OPUST
MKSCHKAIYGVQIIVKHISTLGRSIQLCHMNNFSLCKIRRKKCRWDGDSRQGDQRMDSDGNSSCSNCHNCSNQTQSRASCGAANKINPSTGLFELKVHLLLQMRERKPHLLEIMGVWAREWITSLVKLEKNIEGMIAMELSH